MSDTDNMLGVSGLVLGLKECLARSEIPHTEKLQVLALLVAAFAEGEVDWLEFLT